MAETPRFLITTADQRTWAFDRPAVFLGQWCRWYECRDVWGAMDAIVARPYSISSAQLHRDLDHVRAFEAILWPRLVSILNDFHKTRHKERYWRILLGNWLTMVVRVLHNRVGTLEQCLAEHRIDGTATLVSSGYHLATLTSDAFVWACNDPAWNNILSGRLLDRRSGGGPDQEKIHVEAEPGFRRPSAPAVRTDPVVRLMQSLRKIGVRATDVMIDNTYLPREHVVKLHLALGQMPQVWRREPVGIVTQPSPAIRQILSDRLETQADGAVEREISALVFELMPVCYLEGYPELLTHAASAGFPKRPKAIFTSNNFDSDEVFKIWAAEQTERGATYIIGQHGNVYGTHHQYAPSAEEEFADRFVSWGWANRPNVVPAFNLKHPVAAPAVYDPLGRVLLVELSPAHQTYIDDKVARFEEYFSDQVNFVQGLGDKVRSQVTVRLSGGSRTHHEGEHARWPKAVPGITVDTFDKTMRELVASSRLVVHSYDSTGLLETLTQNVPTMAFWQEGLDHLLESVTPDYQVLIDAGIVHLSPQSAAQAVNERFDTIEQWWGSEKVQAARRHFISKYSRQVDDPAKVLRFIILNAISEVGQSDRATTAS
ncbi:MAG: transferase [Devosia sp.]|uniref:LIC12162 family transferase n=1 Tax=Devosia sp. TaxID=1871048 RepID=UPI00261DB437|nr:LIC12162 family protein [Devosia sp.]MDB5526941.1 transferase [Devosia sp.]